MIDPKTKIGIIKRGGFANGLFGVGAYRVIHETLKTHGLKVSKAVAISASSFSIMLESIGRFDEVLSAWRDLKAENIYNFSYFETLTHPLKRISILNNDPLRLYIGSFVKPHLDEIFSDRAMPFEIVTTDLETGNGVYFSNRDADNKELAIDICMASAGLLPFFPPVTLYKNNKRLILADGAFADDMPVGRLLIDDCNLIFIIDIFGGLPKFEEEHTLYWPDLITRSNQISVAQHSRLRLSLGDKINEGISSGTPDINGRFKKFTPILIKSEIPIEHINFRRFDQDTKTKLISIGYWAAKTTMAKLGLDCHLPCDKLFT